MLGGSNNNSLVPVFLDENLFQYPSNQLQLFGNVPAACNADLVNYSGREHESPAIRSNKRPREAAETNLMQKKLQVSLNQNLYKEDSGLKLKLSYDDEERNSSITSASGSMTATPSIMSSFGDSVTTELDRQNEELERFIKVQGENMWKGVTNIRQRHTTSFLASIGKVLDKKLREKDVEIETLHRKNTELVERIKQSANEAQNWQYRAKYNESVVNILKTNLNQALANQGCDPRLKEGFGDTDLEHDVVSSVPNGGMKCRVCRGKEASVLVMPCRHLSLCKDCDKCVSVCPVCRVEKTIGVEVYMS